MGEKLSNLVNTYLPTVAVIGLLAGIFGGGVYIGGLNKTLDLFEDRVTTLENKTDTMPSRQEFTDLKTSLSDFRKETNNSLEKIMSSLQIKLK